MLEIKENLVSLKGISLRGSFELYNHNQNLAVIFEIVSPSRIQIEIQPRRGIIMQREIKKIKVWVRESNRQKALSQQWEGQSLKINMTMKAQYNRKIFEKLQLKGWDKISQSYDSLIVPIIVSPQAKSLRSEIRDYASNSLSKTNRSKGSLYINSRQPGNEDSGFEEGKVYTSSIAHSNKSNSNKVKNKRLDEQLNFIFEQNRNQKNNDQNRFQRSVQFVRETSPKPPNRNHKTVINPSTFKNQRQTDQYFYGMSQSKSGISDIPSQPRSYQNPRDHQNSQRFMEVLLLAVLAGFFVALGSNFRRLVQ